MPIDEALPDTRGMGALVRVGKPAVRNVEPVRSVGMRMLAMMLVLVAVMAVMVRLVAFTRCARPSTGRCR